MTEYPKLQQHYRDTFFRELMQSSNHFPALKMRLREHFNRFELEDLSKLFAAVAIEAVDDEFLPKFEEGSDGNETTTEDEDVEGEELNSPFSTEAENACDGEPAVESESDRPAPP